MAITMRTPSKARTCNVSDCHEGMLMGWKCLARSAFSGDVQSSPINDRIGTFSALATSRNFNNDRLRTPRSMPDR